MTYHIVVLSQAKGIRHWQFLVLFKFWEFALIDSLFMPVQVDDILGNPATTDQGGVYHLSERGDRLIELSAFRDLLWQVLFCTTNFVP